MQRLDLLLAKEMFDVKEDKQSIYNAFVKYDFLNDTVYQKGKAGDWEPVAVKGCDLSYRKSDIILIGEDVCIRWDKWPAGDSYTLLSKDKDGNYKVYDGQEGALSYPATSIDCTALGYVLIHTQNGPHYFQKTQNGYKECSIGHILEVSPYYHTAIKSLMKTGGIRKAEKLGRWASCRGVLNLGKIRSKQNG